eukprot:15341839-Ditylum_brightwellii.AAC.1
MVLVAHLPVVAVGDRAVEVRGKTKVIHTTIVVINTKPTPEQFALAEASETYVATAIASSCVPNGGDGQAGALLSLVIALVERRERNVILLEACFQTPSLSPPFAPLLLFTKLEQNNSQMAWSWAEAMTSSLTSKMAYSLV